MRDSVRDWARKFLYCAKQKTPTKAKRALLRQQVSGVSLERVAIYITGLFPETVTGNRYIVVISDFFIKWTKAYPVASITADAVADVLVNEFVSRFGVPRLLHSDQGHQFESELFQKTCTLLGIDKTRTIPYLPQSDGQVKRFNRTLKVILSYTSENQVGPCASPSESTGMTPNMLMFGREVELPVDLILGGIGCPEALGESLQAPDYVVELGKRLDIAHEIARKHL